MTSMSESRQGSVEAGPAVVAPAPVVFFPVVLAGAAFSWFFPVSLWPRAVGRALGAALVLVSIALIAAVLREFRRRATPFDARRAATVLVTAGPFRLSRNPGYVAMVLLAAGLGLAAGAVWVLAATGVAAVLVHYLVVLPEEAHLEAAFGEGYRRYRCSVRRWL